MTQANNGNYVIGICKGYSGRTWFVTNSEEDSFTLDIEKARIFHNYSDAKREVIEGDNEVILLLDYDEHGEIQGYDELE